MEMGTGTGTALSIDSLESSRSRAAPGELVPAGKTNPDLIRCWGWDPVNVGVPLCPG